MKEMITFDDVLIEPQFSFVQSRKDVSLKQIFMGYNLELPVIAANMDTICGPAMAKAMGNSGAVGTLHRFCTIEENVQMFKDCDNRPPIVSIGTSKEDLERAEALYAAGARNYVIDIAHGASVSALKQYEELRTLLGNYVDIMVGNFATGQSIKDFMYHLTANYRAPNAFKVGIGGGSMCTTRIVTGCGIPTLASVIDCVQTKNNIVADGGFRTSGDIAKALAAGAKAVMLGGMLAGTDESAAYVKDFNFEMSQLSEEEQKEDLEIEGVKRFLKQRGILYRGSASKESYDDQGKSAEHRTAEGEMTSVKPKGPVKDILQQISAGLKSSLSYVGAKDLEEFRSKAKFIRITGAGMKESVAHGKKD